MMSNKCGCTWFGHSDPNTECHPDCTMAKRIAELEELARLLELEPKSVAVKQRIAVLKREQTDE